jgi:hypothetical protein
MRYVVDANLTDSSTGTVLFPFTINDREGHTTLSEAENRAIRSAEAKINSGYMSALSAFLTQAPKK